MFGLTDVVSTDRSLRSLLDHRVLTARRRPAYGLWFRQAQPAVARADARLTDVVSTDRSLRSLLDHRVLTSASGVRPVGFDKLNQRWCGPNLGSPTWVRLTSRFARCSTTGWSRRRPAHGPVGFDRLNQRQARPAVREPTYAGAVSDQLVIGFDLDMTLIDTVVGFAATLEVLGAELGVDVPDRGADLQARAAAGADARAPLPAEQIRAAGDRFREIYPDRRGADAGVPGRARGAGRRTPPRTDAIVLVTGKYTPNAQLHVDHLGLDVDASRAGCGEPGRARRCPARGRDIYVGDHVHDVEGAQAAGILSVSVLTGGCTREELEAAGTDVVLTDLTEFPAWLDGHLLATRLADARRARSPATAG